MELRCPNCGTRLPWWWRIAEISYRRSGGYYNKCPSCRRWIKVKAEHKRLEKRLREIILFLALPLFIIADDAAKGGNLIKKFDLDFLMEINPELVYLAAFMIVFSVIWSDLKRAKYVVQLSKPSIEKKRLSLKFALALLTPMLVLVNLGILYIYIIYGEWRLLAMVAAVDILSIILIKKEMEQLKKLEMDL
ncbi:hypothetical protein Asulf_00522 [Archaeoglobus sulfaticallidus PM70-1]|uniref:Uncharacterized protein n=1 Tax=Archaeoglobus sulfaticallidus PM70-1 TaxID=387631 RepID=N0BK84_9EURY|nr:hypothetical protein [Archaeoglobus sulfaticallidus]AGK60545.1 hypothetical protein Asulf_00522 [Archaeoglobus sulfaticallidus PM70-1]